MSIRTWVGVPDRFRRVYDKAMTGKSQKAGIKAFCHECFGNAPGCTHEIHECTDKGCPLYPYRPYRKARAGLIPIDIPRADEALPELEDDGGLMDDVNA